MNATLLSAQNKLRDRWEMDNLPNDSNNVLWTTVREMCDLTYPEVASLQNEISRKNKDKSGMNYYSIY